MNWKKEDWAFASNLIMIISFPPVITFLHYSFRKTHLVLEELYYLPLFLGAFVFGPKGALLTYLYVSACYLPFFSGNWASAPLAALDRFLHLAFSGFFTLLVSSFILRQKRTRDEAEKDRYLIGLGHSTASIVHDLRSHLITLLIFCRLVREGKRSVEAGLQGIIESAQSMERIADDAMDFARPLVLHLEREDIRKAVEQVCASWQATAEERGICLSWEIPPHPVSITVDGSRLQRALLNLIRNALDASGEGQRVWVSLENLPGKASIKVQDCGSGIDPETLKNIFLPFYSKKAHGTGLGMAIVKKIIDAHRGEIKISSKPGLGTEVIIELPLGASGEEKTGSYSP
jgi:signal transduction histidine kinase